MSDDKIILEPIRQHRSIAEEYYGKFKIKKWLGDLDSFLEEVISNWARSEDI